MIIIEKRRLGTGPRVVISVVILLALLIGAGVLYTYYFGPTATPKVLPETQAATKNPLAQAPKVDPRAPVGVSVQTLSSPVTPGSNTMATIKTKPGATCTITLSYGTVKAKDSGLAPIKADEFGVATWSWTVDPAAQVGKWPVNFRCADATKSGVVDGTLEVVKQLAPGQ